MNKRIAIVGTSRGIGKALVDNLAAAGHEIWAFGRNLSEMNRAFGDLDKVHLQSLDLEKDVTPQLTHIFPEETRFDALVNNAGLLINKPFTELNHQDIQRSYQVNVVGVMQTVQCFLPFLGQNAHIVNISSMGGFQGTVKFPGLCAYSTSKAALCSFTELFAEEFKESGIHMNCLALGAVQTEMLEEAFPGYNAPISANEMATFIADFALNGHKWFNGKILPVSLSTP